MIERTTSTGFVKSNGEEMKVSEFREKFKESELGQKVMTMNRFWDPYLPPDVPYYKWMSEGIGPHGNIFRHMDEQVKEAEWFFAFCGDMFDEEDKKIIELTAQIHDGPEYKKGDISFKKRTKMDEDSEAGIMRGLIKDIYGDEFNSDELERLINSVIEVAYDQNSRRGRAFHAIELIGYENAALQAWYNSNGSESNMNTALRVLAHEVVPSHIPELVNLSDEYPPVKKFLVDEIPTFMEIIEEAEVCETQIPEEVDRAKSAINNFLNNLVRG